MHDVLVLALTIFFIKSQGVYDAASLYGVYFFTAAVLLMILSYAWLSAPTACASGQPSAVRRARPAAAARARIAPFRNFVLSASSSSWRRCSSRSASSCR